MLSKEDFMVIQALVKRGVYQRDIAEQLGVQPRTVRRALARGGPPGGHRRRRPSLLDCDRMVWLDQGQILAIGPPKKVLNRYRAAVESQ